MNTLDCTSSKYFIDITLHEYIAKEQENVY